MYIITGVTFPASTQWHGSGSPGFIFRLKLFIWSFIRMIDHSFILFHISLWPFYHFPFSSIKFIWSALVWFVILIGRFLLMSCVLFVFCRWPCWRRPCCCCWWCHLLSLCRPSSWGARRMPLSSRGQMIRKTPSTTSQSISTGSTRYMYNT